MGTGNFYYRNASKVFAICMSHNVPVLDDEGNETSEFEDQSPEEWQVNDTLEYIQERMGENKKYSFTELDGWDNDAPRSFPSKYIGCWSIDKEYAGVSIEVQITATANAGYYDGACLDWTIKTFVAGSEADEAEPSDFTYYNDNVNEGLAKIISAKANAWLDRMKEEMEIDIETFFAEVCEIKLNRVATFSNGETIYAKAD